ncbi:MAG: hypothetical protein SCK28_02930 [Bacillota bacterium]|nr:hypothetical protein [Bacillota bacterium]
MSTALLYDYPSVQPLLCEKCGIPMKPSGIANIDVTLYRGQIKSIANNEVHNYLDWTCHSCYNEEEEALTSKLESFLGSFDENVQRVSLKYNDEHKPVEATVYMCMVTGNGNKGPYSFYPPDEFITHNWQNKNYNVSYRGKMYYFPTDCSTCASKKCSDCSSLEIGAKWILGEKTIPLDSEQTFDQIADKLLANI